MRSTSKVLVLLRHAKSSWADPHQPDHDRPLNARGRDAAARIGTHLRRNGPWPELVLCSSASRTRQTLERLQLPKSVECMIEDSLYGATATELLGRVRTVPSRYGTVLLIGHNPGIEDLARMLDRQELVSVAKFPTAALAVLHAAVDTWPDISPGEAGLDAFVTPDTLASRDTTW